MQELEERFEKLEMQVIWLEGKLAELGHIVEHDLDTRIGEATGEAAVRQIEYDLQRFESRRRRQDALVQNQQNQQRAQASSQSGARVEVEVRESSLSITTTTGGGSGAKDGGDAAAGAEGGGATASVWSVAYDAIAGLFR